MYVSLFYQLSEQFPEKHCLSSWSQGDNDNECTTHPTHLPGYCGSKDKKVNFLEDHLGLDLNPEPVTL